MNMFLTNICKKTDDLFDYDFAYEYMQKKLTILLINIFPTNTCKKNWQLWKTDWWELSFIQFWFSIHCSQNKNDLSYPSLQLIPKKNVSENFSLPHTGLWSQLSLIRTKIIQEHSLIGRSGTPNPSLYHYISSLINNNNNEVCWIHKTQYKIYSRSKKTSYKESIIMTN